MMGVATDRAVFRAELWLAALLATSLAGACGMDEARVDSSMTELAGADAPFEIAGIVDRGGALERHHVELYVPAPYEVCDDVRCVEARYSAAVFCNGARAEAVAVHATSGQVNVSFPERPSGSSCSFQLIQDGIEKRYTAERLADIAPPAIEIQGINDRGVAAGRRWFELYGRFAETSAATATVSCHGAPQSARVEYLSAGQVNVSIPSIGVPASCSFALTRQSDGRVSPRFATRVGGPAPALDGFIGAYVWGGFQPGFPFRHDVLTQALRELEGAGITATTRVVMTPTMRSGGSSNWYHFDFAGDGPDGWATRCPETEPFLPCAARLPAYQNAFSRPGLRTIAITAYDSATSGPRGGGRDFFDPDVLANPEVENAVRSEYRDLTLALYETQRGTGKRFILLNWETDNHLTCGAYDYVMKLDHRTACDQHQIPPWRRVDFFVRWFQLRQEGIRQGRAIAAASGWTGVEVNDGIEVATLRLLHNHGYPSTIRDIVPRVRPDVVSYSSWESVERGRFDEDLRDMAALAAPAELMLGELGHKQMSAPGNAHIAWRLVESARAARRVGIRIAIVWAAFFNTDLSDGLLHVDGSETATMVALRAGLAVPLAPPGAPTIAGAIEYGPSLGGARVKRLVELYGTYPDLSLSTYAAAADCDGGGYRAIPIVGATTSQGDAGQINVELDTTWFDTSGPDEMWCSFRLAHGSRWGDPIGPRRFCKGRRCTVPWPNDPTAPYDEP
jgi:hypothetical protein